MTIPRPIIARAVVLLLVIGPVTATLYLTGAILRHRLRKRSYDTT